MTDYASYAAARRAFGDELAAFHFERLKRERKIEEVKNACSEAVKALEALKQEASQSAGANWRSTGGASGKLNQEQVRAAIGKVQAASWTYGGFFEKMQRKAEAPRRQPPTSAPSLLCSVRRSTCWLRNDEHVKLQEIYAAQSEAEAEIQESAETLRSETAALIATVGAPAQPLSHESWQENQWEDGEGIIRLVDAYHWIGDQKYEHPYLAKLPGENFFVWTTGSSPTSPPDRQRCAPSRGSMVRPGRVRLLLVDPTQPR